MGCFPNISKRWKQPKILLYLMVLELLGTVAALAMFGIAEPNLYRTRMWQIGYDNKFNSNPKQILYAYANHRPIPTTPFVWSAAYVLSMEYAGWPVNCWLTSGTG